MRGIKTLGGALVFAGLVAVSVGTAGLAGAAGGGTSGGNAGTIKIEGHLLTPPGSANEPHVPCTFNLSFFGYPNVTETATVTFKAQPPSGTGQLVPPTQGPSTFTFPGLGPPGSTLDHTETYTLDVSGLTYQSQQGYHIKVTADVSNATGPNGADEKYKVFWLNCPETSPTTTTTPTTIGGGGGVQQSTTTTTTLGTTTTTTGTTKTTTGTTTTTTPNTGATTTPPTSGGTGNEVASTTVPGVTPVAAGVPGAQPAAAGLGPAQAPQSGQAGVAPGQAGVAPGQAGVAPGQAGVAPASSQAAQAAQGPVPSGAGTDLGFFHPGSWAGSPVESWGLLTAGGVLMTGVGAGLRRRSATTA